MAKKSITVYVEEDVYDKLRVIAKSKRWSINVLMNWLIERLLDTNGQPVGK